MQKIKESRALSFIAVAIIYILAALVGVASYIVLPFGVYINLFLADIIATVFTFIFSLVFKNASVYDPYWSVQPIVITLAFSFFSEITVYRVLLLFAVFFWGIRLTANWAYTFKGLCHQDWRYTILSEKTGKFYPLINFIGIHFVPTLVVYFATIPAVYALRTDSEISVLSVLFIAVSVLAACLQGVSDIQMHRYRKNRKTPFIREGLWKYSRHPNYLGEILMWWGTGLSVYSLFPSEPWLLIGAVINTALFLSVSVPMADGRQSKKEGFFEYKRKTRMLLPLPKRSKK